MWTTHFGCEDVINKTWNNEVFDSKSYRLIQKLKVTRNALKEWNKKIFGNLKVRKNKLEKELVEVHEKLDGEQRFMEHCKKEKEIRKELENLAEQD